jgi:Rad3-related DNA helicase
MVDEDIIGRIDQLIDEERQLRSRTVGQGLSDDDRSRLDLLERRLDQCWDLLRQRRARAEFHADPAQAKVRPTDQVESYRQ